MKQKISYQKLLGPKIGWNEDVHKAHRFPSITEGSHQQPSAKHSDATHWRIQWVNSLWFS